GGGVGTRGGASGGGASGGGGRGVQLAGTRVALPWSFLAHRQDHQAKGRTNGSSPGAPHRPGDNPAACGGVQPFSVSTSPHCDLIRQLISTARPCHDTKHFRLW